MTDTNHESKCPLFWFHIIFPIPAAVRAARAGGGAAGPRPVPGGAVPVVRLRPEVRQPLGLPTPPAGGSSGDVCLVTRDT